MKGKWTPHIITVNAFVVFIVLGLASASEPKLRQESVQPQRTKETEKGKWNIYEAFLEGTKDINSRSPVLLSLARYNNYEQMPDYMKMVYDAIDAYITSFRTIRTLGTCWSQDKKVWIEWEAQDEKASIKLAISRLEATRNANNSKIIDTYINRLSLGMARNIVIAATDYLNFIVAVSNAESSYYDKTSKDRLSFDSTSGVFRVITREDQLLFAERYNSVKNEDYKTLGNGLLGVSQMLLDSLNSDLLLPMRIK